MCSYKQDRNVQISKCSNMESICLWNWGFHKLKKRGRLFVVLKHLKRFAKARRRVHREYLWHERRYYHCLRPHLDPLKWAIQYLHHGQLCVHAIGCCKERMTSRFMSNSGYPIAKTKGSLVNEFICSKNLCKPKRTLEHSGFGRLPTDHQNHNFFFSATKLNHGQHSKRVMHPTKF